MAKTFAKLQTITLNTLQEVLRKRVLYAVPVLLLLVGHEFWQGLKFMSMADGAGELGSVQNYHPKQVLEVWDFAATVLAVFLGASGLSSELGGKTIVHVLSRPVTRYLYLTSRWLGILIFLVGFQLFGIGLTILLMQICHVPVSPVFLTGCVELLGKMIFLSGLSLGLSVGVPPVLAGCLAFFISFAGELLRGMLRHPDGIVHSLANSAYYLLPARMPVDLLEASSGKELLHPDYPLYARVIADHLGYTILIFAVGCAIFARRELRLR